MTLSSLPLRASHSVISSAICDHGMIAILFSLICMVARAIVFRLPPPFAARLHATQQLHTLIGCLPPLWPASQMRDLNPVSGQDARNAFGQWRSWWPTSIILISRLENSCLTSQRDRIPCTRCTVHRKAQLSLTMPCNRFRVYGRIVSKSHSRLKSPSCRSQTDLMHG